MNSSNNSQNFLHTRSSVRLRILIWVLILLGGAILGMTLDLIWFHHLFFGIGWHLATASCGLILLKIVFTISKVTGRTLAKHGKQGDIPKFETNRLVTTGAYSCMRHPMHFGLLFFPLAIALVLGSPTFIFLIAPIEMIIMVVMVLTLEEHEAKAKFGQQYEDYRHTVPAFSLDFNCLKKLFDSY